MLMAQPPLGLIFKMCSLEEELKKISKPPLVLTFL